MKPTYNKPRLFTIKLSALLFLTLFFLNFQTIQAQSFSSSTLQGAVIANPTSLQFGPDNRLYVAQQNGLIKIFTVDKVSANNYQVKATEIIDIVKKIPNHNDDGSLSNQTSRLVTGILVTGSTANPVIYVASSDNRFGAGSNGDVNLCTNSGIISKLTKTGSTWSKVDLVRGLPRSEENHAPNGLQIDETNNILFLAVGGSTNAGGVSKMWTYITEYALTACILSIDLGVIEAMSTKNDPTGQHPYKYDIPTLDDPTRPNNPDGTDVNDPWGGNDGLNQGKIVSGGPVQVYAPGFRNAYDIVITKSRKMYTVDNGPNQGWGGHPMNEGSNGTVTNNYPTGEPGSLSAGPNDPMVNNLDGVELIGNIDTYTPGSYYGGHPCPIRANPAGAGLYTHEGEISGGTGVWRTSKTDPKYPLSADWPPVPLSMANPKEGDYQNPGETDLSLITLKPAGCGICEYTASNFGMQGNLLIAGFDGNIHRIKLNASGNSVLNSLGPKKLNQDPYFASGLGKSLDIVAQSDTDPFPGTIWVAAWANNQIVIFEPQTVNCTALDNNSDDDMDKYSNADEIDNGTNPCSGASKPKDNDGDLVSDLNDTDDDNDGIVDKQDYFAIDPENGLTTNVPTHYALFNYDPGTGFFGLGFTGLMGNGTSDYLNLFNESNLIAGGATGALTVKEVPGGDALKNNNTEQYAFQFGVNTSTSTGPFTVRAGVIGPFFNNQTPQNFQSQGLFIGTGDQDNYFKLLLNANGGAGGIQVIHENGGVADSIQYSVSAIPSSFIYFYLYVDPASGNVQPYYKADGGEVTQLGTPIQVSGPLLTAIQSSTKALAVGITSTSKSGSPYTASWDFISVDKGLSIVGVQDFVKTSSGIKVYPNPTKDKLLINSELSENTAVDIIIYNYAGKIIDQIPISLVPGATDTEIDLSSLKPGMYFVKINFEKNRFDSFKIIKQ